MVLGFIANLKNTHKFTLTITCKSKLCICWTLTETVNNNLENESKELLISEEDDQTTAIDITDTTTNTTTIQSPQQWKEERWQLLNGSGGSGDGGDDESDPEPRAEQKYHHSKTNSLCNGNIIVNNYPIDTDNEEYAEDEYNGGLLPPEPKIIHHNG